MAVHDVAKCPERWLCYHIFVLESSHVGLRVATPGLQSRKLRMEAELGRQESHLCNRPVTLCPI